MSKSPVVSVTMPVYNAERYVAQAVESILAQTFGEFEFLIINDGSTDRSLKILQKYAAKDDRIRLTSRENRGIGATRNELLTQARGEFLAVMDSDDVAMVDRFALQVDFLRQNPDVVCVGGAYNLVDETGRLLIHRLEPVEDREIQPLMLVGHTCINHPSAMMRRSVVMQVGAYNVALAPAEDIDLFLKLGEAGKLANLQTTVLNYRQHSSSVSQLKHQTQTDNKRKACEQAWQRRGIEGHFEATEPWRPGSDRASQLLFMLKYGWWAFNSRQRSTACHYGMRAIVLNPFNLDAWKLLACAIAKPLPPSNQV